MIEHTRTAEKAGGGPALRVPMQAAPVDRSTAPAVAGASAGVEADGFLDVLGDVAKVALPLLGGAFGI